MPFFGPDGKNKCACGMMVSNRGLATYSHLRGKLHREGIERNTVIYIGTCRLCQKSVYSGGGLEHSGTSYATRHNAHYTCMVEKWDEGIFDRFSVDQVHHLFPYKLLEKAGLLEKASQRKKMIEAVRMHKEGARP